MLEEGKAQGCVALDLDSEEAVADLFAWIYWEDLSYLEGLLASRLPLPRLPTYPVAERRGLPGELSE
jgi:hypothetical protein